jgi:hypothetical protein
MPTYTVHLADWDKMRALKDNRETLWNVTTKGEVMARDLYMEPYTLEAKGINEVFEILNIRHPADYRRRSMSVSDVVVDESGDAWVCRGTGWKPVRNWDPSKEKDSNGSRLPNAEVGMSATVGYHSDSYPATVIWVSPDGKRIKAQEDNAERLDSNGMSEMQEYSYTRDPNGKIHEASFRKKIGRYVVKGESHKGTRILAGRRRKFHDFSF